MARFVQLQRGVAAIEFALLLIPLVVMVLGISEFGRALYEYNIILKATRDASRYLSLQQPGGSVDPVAVCLVKYGDDACFTNPGYTGTPLLPNLLAATVTVCDEVRCPGTHLAQGSDPVVNLITVTVTDYVFVPYIPFAPASISNITFGPISTTVRK